jgi:hypothetical protein
MRKKLTVRSLLFGECLIQLLTLSTLTNMGMDVLKWNAHMKIPKIEGFGRAD